MMILVLFIFAVFNFFSAGEKLSNCPNENIRFEKVLGLRPPHGHHPLLLYKAEPNTPLTVECTQKCQQNEDCHSFVLHYNTSHCFWFRSPLDGYQEEDAILDPNVAWFQKVCLKAENCQKDWVFERIPGAILIGNDAKVLPTKVSRSDCQQHCLDETSFNCRSIKFKIVESTTETLGLCTLSDSDRRLMPNSYRVSTYNEEYFENQCSKIITNEFCAFEEYENAALLHVDNVYGNQTKEQCENLCQETTRYNCRGYGIIPTPFTSIYSKNILYTCAIHSEDSKVHGPKLLQDYKGAKYYEKAPCLNITVNCSETYMTIRYQPQFRFNGKIYMQGYSDRLECFAVGKEKNLVQLKIGLLGNQCGVSQAQSNINRTLISSTMVLQYNPIIQTQSDRLIKVGCLYGNTTKVLVGTGVNFTLSPPNIGTTNVQGNSNLPHVEMRIVDLNSQEEVSDTQIGQELQLIIEMKPLNDAFDIRAGHLVAMTETGNESILLLNDEGCPTNLDVFPPLKKTKTATSLRLESVFQAFKFSSSSIIRFSVIVQFCPKKCSELKCEESNVIRKREVNQKVQLVNGTRIQPLDRREFDTKGRNESKLPLEYIIVVRSGRISPDRLIYGEGSKIVVAGYDYEKNQFCINDTLLIAIILTWIIIQIIMIASCIVIIRRYKRHYEEERLRQSQEELHKNFGIGFSNLDGRRVHFADNHGLSSYQ